MAFDLQQALHAVVEKQGSDLHLKVPSQPLMRLQGKLSPLDGTEALTPADTERVLREMLTSSDRLAEFARDGEIDFSYTVRGLARFRVNAFRQRGWISIACRVVPFTIRSVEELGLPEAVDLPDEARQDPTWFRTAGERYGRDGCRVPVPWSATQPAYGFSPTGASWLPQPASWAALARDRQVEDTGSTLTLYRTLLAARRCHELGSGALEWLDGYPAAYSHSATGM